MNEKQLWWNAFAAATAVSMGAWPPAEWMTATSADGAGPEGDGDETVSSQHSRNSGERELRGHR